MVFNWAEHKKLKPPMKQLMVSSTTIAFSEVSPDVVTKQGWVDLGRDMGCGATVSTADASTEAVLLTEAEAKPMAELEETLDRLGTTEDGLERTKKQLVKKAQGRGDGRGGRRHSAGRRHGARRRH